MINCIECGSVIEGNLRGDEKEWTISCWRCVDKKIQAIEQLEQRAKITITDTSSYRTALALADNEARKEELVGRLKLIREQSNWPQITMASKLGITQSYYAKMEKGLKPLSDKALRMIREAENSEK